MKEKKKHGTEVKKPKFITAVGKRKEAVAMATMKPGTGIVRINKKVSDKIENEMLRLKIQEPLLIAGDGAKKFDIYVHVHGGGTIGQAEAARQAMARCLSQSMPELRKKYLEYDWSLLVADPRRKEQHKPPHSSWGARRHKQRSKR